MDLLLPSCCCITLAVTLLSACDAPSSSASSALPAPSASASGSFFTAAVPVPTPTLTAPPPNSRASTETNQTTDCLSRTDPQHFASIGCVAGMHVGQSIDGTPCRLMVDMPHKRMTFQAGTTTVTLDHERLAMSAQGEAIYNLEGLRDANGASGVKLVHLQAGATKPGDMLTQAITVMTSGKHGINWTYTQDGAQPALRVQCAGSA